MGYLIFFPLSRTLLLFLIFLFSSLLLRSLIPFFSFCVMYSCCARFGGPGFEDRVWPFLTLSCAVSAATWELS
ncbi:uncharacterized protein B0T15DRAFT_527103 [Chaetomium strumarium]|uniref:Uncharacterized protein n=1 Tax=Chaetomium strumarium TaxID=1170767 RepID=A0AAJ0GUJ3_9PEZI|nr:hypothetical protein B0T15DRAFT_527103 [Chaetomium strumarium]